MSKLEAGEKEAGLKEEWSRYFTGYRFTDEGGALCRRVYGELSKLLEELVEGGHDSRIIEYVVQSQISLVGAAHRMEAVCAQSAKNRAEKRLEAFCVPSWNDDKVK